jgi:ankyrin repeat protein
MNIRLKRFVTGMAFGMLVPALAQAADVIPDHYKKLYFEAAREGRTDLLGGMIKDGVPVDLRDEHGYTALIIAAYDDQPAAVDLLLEKHADPCATDLGGDNALMGVAFKGELDIAERLVGRCDVNHRNDQGQTAAMMAALFGHADMIRFLAHRGADLSLQDAAGDTAESLARQQGNAAMTTLLGELESTTPAHAAASRQP